MNKFIKNNLPEILTGISVVGVISSNALFIRAAKKEMEDHNKKHYIFPSIVTLATLGTIIASNRVSNSQKASIAAGATLLASKYIDEYNNLRDHLSPEAQSSLDELSILASDAYSNDETFSSTMQLYYLPQFDITFKATSEDVSDALLYIDHCFSDCGEVYLINFLASLGVGSLTEHLIAEKLKWRVNRDNYESGIQHITVTQYEKTLSNGLICHYIEFNDRPRTEDMWKIEYGEDYDNYI